MPIRQPDPDPPSAVSIARALSARREELARDAPDEVEVQRSREATILLTTRRRLANIAAGCGRRCL